MILGPIGENRPVASVGDEFFRELCYFRVEVVHYVVDYAGSLGSSSWICVEAVGLNSVIRLKTVHVDMSILTQLSRKFRSQQWVQRLREVSESILHRLLLLVVTQTGPPHWSVRDFFRPGFQLRQGV